ncbi:hypothetical protein DVH05_023127 [Phytophthora capsici]|nr:hypothetical protein DVH05_023127 [Phytophthora capsici]
MKVYAWCLLLVLLVAQTCMLSGGEQLFAQASDLIEEYPTTTSLCGENLAKETGTLNNLYYVFYQTSAVKVDIPVILWLSGGPGCSGLVALLFENGPCSFDDETDSISLNPYSWTGLAHVIYLDQPKGTGYSDGDNGITHPWSLGTAADDMKEFLQQFYLLHPELKANGFYIFGESYAGHYVPDLAVRMLDQDRSLPTLKGIAIGNGVVSTTAWAASILPFFQSSPYEYDFLGSNEEDFHEISDRFKSTIANCVRSGNLRHSDSINPACDAALESLNNIEGSTATAVLNLGRNVYDIRRECHQDDAIQLCYRFSRLETFVNTPAATAYFDEAPHKWKLCSSGALQRLAAMDQLEESESNVVQTLEHGVRVLIYGGDADTVVNWMSQDSWTRNLDWMHQEAFRSASFNEQMFNGRSIGQVRTSHGLSFMRVFNAGHMVPHDQPAIAYEMVRSFLNDDPGSNMFS